MARCPSCDKPLPVAAINCEECRAIFGGESAWQPVAETPAEAAELRRLYPGRQTAPAPPADLRKYRLVLFAVAAAGVVAHLGLYAEAADLASQFEKPGMLQNVVGALFMLGWLSIPYIVVLAGLALRSASAISLMVLLTGGLIVLDLAMYPSGGSADWYLVLAPPVLAALACICLGVAFLVQRAST